MNPRDAVLLAAASVVCSLVSVTSRGAQPAVGLLPHGTVVDASTGPGDRLRTLLVADSRLIGDHQVVSESVAKALQSLPLVITAVCDRVDGEHRLRQIGLGYGLSLDQTRVTITQAGKNPPAAASSGEVLGLIGDQVLTRLQAGLTDATVLIRTTQLVLFEVDAMVQLEAHGGNVSRRLRHLIWIHPTRGTLAMALWLVGGGPAELRAETRWPIRLVAEGTRHRRPISVDADEFFLSIPSDAAFGLAELPPGRSLAWTDCRRKRLTQAKYDEQSLAKTLECLNESIE